MYREKIDAFIDAHRQELVEDVCELCRINSERMPAEEDMPLVPERLNVWTQLWIWQRDTDLTQQIMTDM